MTSHLDKSQYRLSYYGITRGSEEGMTLYKDAFCTTMWQMTKPFKGSNAPLTCMDDYDPPKLHLLCFVV